MTCIVVSTLKDDPSGKITIVKECLTREEAAKFIASRTDEKVQYRAYEDMPGQNKMQGDKVQYREYEGNK